MYWCILVWRVERLERVVSCVVKLLSAAERFNGRGLKGTVLFLRERLENIHEFRVCAIRTARARERESIRGLRKAHA